MFLLTQRRTGGVRDAVANRNEYFPPWRGHPAIPVRPGCAVGPSGAWITRPRESPFPTATSGHSLALQSSCSQEQGTVGPALF